MPVYRRIRGTSTHPTIRMDDKQMKLLRFYQKPRQLFLPSLPLPSDPWDPGLTAKDLLFRGGYQFRRHPRAVLDVTEQVRGPARWTVPWSRGYAS